MNKAQIQKTLNSRGKDAASAYCCLPTFNKKFRLAPSSTFGRAFNQFMNNLYGVVPYSDGVPNATFMNSLNKVTDLSSPVKKW